MSLEVGSMSQINAQAQVLIERIGAIDYSQQNYLEERIRSAFDAHLTALNLPLRPVELYHSTTAARSAARDAARDAAWSAAWSAAWDAARDAAWSAASDAAWSAAWDAARDAASDAAWDAAWDAARSAAWDAARDAAWDAAWSAAIVNSTQNSKKHSEFRAIWLPFVDALESGLFSYWITAEKVIALVRPAMHIVNGRLHADGQPAVVWSDEEQYFFWNGVQVSEKYGAVLSDCWQAEWLLKEQNAELRQVLIQGIGYDRLCQELNAQKINSWREYTLLRIEAEIDIEPIYLLKMTCPSTQFIHALRVPPDIQSAREAIQWVNWGIDPEKIVMES
jgi:hypothetical protein